MTHSHPAPSSIRDDSICESSLHPNKSSGDIGELKPCRKCGVLDFELWDGRGTQAYLVCNECGQEEGVQVVDLFDQDERPSWDDKLLCYPPHAVKRTNEHLIEEWNTRTPDPESAAEIERLRRELDAANSNHRSMAHQLAETGIRLEHAESAVAAAWEAAAKIAETFFFNDIGKLQVGPSIQDGIASAIRAAGAERNSTQNESRDRLVVYEENQ